MAAACAAGAALMLVLTAGAWGAVLAGSLAPFVAAAITWVVVERLHRRAPAQVTSTMIWLFGAKLVGFGAYVAAVVVLLPVETRAFVVTLISQYIMLHFMEALLLRRLFAGGARRPGMD